MPEELVRTACEKAGSYLHQYRDGTKAVVQLPDSRKIAVTIERDLVWISQTHGFLDLLIDVPVICSWNLSLFQEENRTGSQHTQSAIAAAVLDTLVERLAQCDSLYDLITKAALGSLDPFEAVNRRFDDAVQEHGAAVALQPTGTA